MYALAESLDVSTRDILEFDSSLAFPEPLLDRTRFEHWQELPSGRTALQWSLKAAGLDQNDKVIIPAYTCWAVRSVVESVAEPVFVDVEIPNYTVDIDELRRKATEEIDAIVAVHMYGKPCDMASIAEVAREIDAVVIEDACQALGTTHLKSRVGKHSDYCVFSFRYYKEATSFQGGVALCDQPPDEEPHAVLRLARAKLAGIYCFDLMSRRMPPFVYEPIRRRVLDPVSRKASKPAGQPGPRDLTNWQRSMLAKQYRRLSSRVSRRRRNAELYTKRLPAEFTLPNHSEEHAFFRYPILVPEGERGSFVRRLRRRGIGCSTMYAYLLSDGAEHPKSRQAAGGMVNIPVHAALDQDDIGHITDIVTRTWEEQR